jgi:hypothetical protein
MNKRKFQKGKIIGLNVDIFCKLAGFNCTISYKSETIRKNEKSLVFTERAQYVLNYD